MTEAVCDKDGFIANVWRGIQFAPDEVARWCDWPINHADLCARRTELIKNEERLLENLIADPNWYDAVLAGYWVWAASCWIGSGLTRPNGGPYLSKAENGITSLGKRPQLTGFTDKGVCAAGKRPDLKMDCLGKGVHAEQVPLLDHGKGICAARSERIYSWMRELSNRLRNVRVVCGDWSRVCGGNWQDNNGSCGMFFDPPYGVTDRDTDVYHHDSTDVAAAVNAWVLQRGRRETYRIVLAGYREEHHNLLAHGWTERTWKANGGYGNQSKSGGRKGNQNKNREALFFSPHCVQQQGRLL